MSEAQYKQAIMWVNYIWINCVDMFPEKNRESDELILSNNMYHIQRFSIIISGR